MSNCTAASDITIFNATDFKKEFENESIQNTANSGLMEKQEKARVEQIRQLWHTEKSYFQMRSFSSYKTPTTNRMTMCTQHDLLMFQKIKWWSNESKVMSLSSVSKKKGKHLLFFIDQAVKIDTNYYINCILKNHLLPYASALYRKEKYCFHQASAPSHQ